MTRPFCFGSFYSADARVAGALVWAECSDFEKCFFADRAIDMERITWDNIMGEYIQEYPR